MPPAWRTLKAAPAANQYPRMLPVNWVEFDQPVKARAVRLRITQPADEAKSHPHVKGNTKDGKRVWLGELLALEPLADRPLEAAAPRAAETVHPPIVDGLETIRRLPETPLAVTEQQLAAAQQYFVDSAAERVRREGRDTLLVAMRAAPPKVDGRLDDWADAAWVTIDQRITKVGDWGSRPDVTSAAVALAGDRLYVAFRTSDPALLRNTGESVPMLFKTGGALDLMIGTSPAADPNRREPVEGDLRLLVTMAKGARPLAVLYRPVVPGTKEPAAFSSPVRTVKIDRVDDVSKDVELAADKDGSYEFSVPLAVLGLKPRAGLMIRGDVGILRGDGFRTIQRVYWQNKATGITSDVPSEAALAPLLWGRWQFGGR